MWRLVLKVAFQNTEVMDIKLVIKEVRFASLQIVEVFTSKIQFVEVTSFISKRLN